MGPSGLNLRVLQKPVDVLQGLPLLSLKSHRDQGNNWRKTNAAPTFETGQKNKPRMRMGGELCK